MALRGEGGWRERTKNARGSGAAASDAAPLSRFFRCHSVATGGKQQDLIGASSITFTPGGSGSRFPQKNSALFIVFVVVVDGVWWEILK